MKRLIFLIVTLIVAGAATSVLRSHSLLHFGEDGMPSIQALQSTQLAGTLPEQEIEDRSVLFVKEPKR